MSANNTDFDALRAERNKKVMEVHQELAEKLGVPVQSLKSTFNPSACYCDCSSGGPCEHKWDGEGYESEDGFCWSATCSRCGCTAMSHDMRVLP